MRFAGEFNIFTSYRTRCISESKYSEKIAIHIQNFHLGLTGSGANAHS